MIYRLVLIVGAADTGRAPMAAALLARLLVRHGLDWMVASAGIVGHDGDPAEPEARSAMLALGLNISGHLARSLSDELVSDAVVLVAVESGVARVIRARYPDRAPVTLGELAGRPRDIPDPFRMQMGAWIQYAGEIEALLVAGLPRLRALVGDDSGGAEPAPETEGRGGAGAAEARDGGGAAAPAEVERGGGPGAGGVAAGGGAPGQARLAAVDRAARLLALVADLPGVVDWGAARAQLEADLAVLEVRQTADDLARPYVALLRAQIAQGPGAPPAPQARALAAAVERLRAPISPADLEDLA